MKMERFNEILNKLMQMEDAEENLEMVPLYEEALELSKEIYGEYNLKTLEIYNNYALQLSVASSDKLMILVAMDMGEEFELPQNEVENLLDFLINQQE